MVFCVEEQDVRRSRPARRKTERMPDLGILKGGRFERLLDKIDDEGDEEKPVGIIRGFMIVLHRV